MTFPEANSLTTSPISKAEYSAAVAQFSAYADADTFVTSEAALVDQLYHLGRCIQPVMEGLAQIYPEAVTYNRCPSLDRTQRFSKHGAYAMWRHAQSAGLHELRIEPPNQSTRVITRLSLNAVIQDVAIFEQVSAVDPQGPHGYLSLYNTRNEVALTDTVAEKIRVAAIHRDVYNTPLSGYRAFSEQDTALAEATARSIGIAAQEIFYGHGQVALFDATLRSIMRTMLNRLPSP